MLMREGRGAGSRAAQSIVMIGVGRGGLVGRQSVVGLEKTRRAEASGGLEDGVVPGAEWASLTLSTAHTTHTATSSL